jgi:hypothetical protein
MTRPKAKSTAVTLSGIEIGAHFDRIFFHTQRESLESGQPAGWPLSFLSYL